jgi:hypothetical protein
MTAPPHASSPLLNKIRHGSCWHEPFCLTHAAIKIDPKNNQIQVTGTYDVDFLPTKLKPPSPISLLTSDAGKTYLKQFIKHLGVYAVGAMLREDTLQVFPLTYDSLMKQSFPVDDFLLVLTGPRVSTNATKEVLTLSTFTIKLVVQDVRSTAWFDKPRVEHAFGLTYECTDGAGGELHMVGGARLYYQAKGVFLAPGHPLTLTSDGVAVCADSTLPLLPAKL